MGPPVPGRKPSEKPGLRTWKEGRPVSPELFEERSAALAEDDPEESRGDMLALRRCLDRLPRRQREMLARRYERRQSFE
jgi:DNA-directed RNA polymerase specialized sigma24 family protein